MHMENKKISHAGYHHTAIQVSDFDRSFRFYTEGLGCVPKAIWGEPGKQNALLYFCEGGMIELLSGGTGETPVSQGWVHLAIATDRPDEAYQAALDAGAKPRTPVFDTVIEAETPMPVRIGFVFGPDGEVLEFFQDKSEA